MPWTLAIEIGIEPEYEEALQAAAWNAGWKVELVQHVPFTEEFVRSDDYMETHLPTSLMQDPKVWFHGSIQAAKAAQTATKWQVHAPWNKLRCQTYYLMLQERILQRDHRFTTVAEILTLKDELFSSELVEDGSLFFRPDGNDKVFTGGCISVDDFDHGYNLMTFYEPPPETLVVVARPQKIRSEARFLVVGGKLITGSLYKVGGQTIRIEAHSSLMETAEELLAFCLAQGFNPAASWVLDLAETVEGWSIIEVGASSCCGLYKCDMGLFIEALEGQLGS